MRGKTFEGARRVRGRVHRTSHAASTIADKLMAATVWVRWGLWEGGGSGLSFVRRHRRTLVQRHRVPGSGCGGGGALPPRRGLNPTIAREPATSLPPLRSRVEVDVETAFTKFVLYEVSRVFTFRLARENTYRSGAMATRNVAHQTVSLYCKHCRL